jgi:hypothetical protein
MSGESMWHGWAARYALEGVTILDAAAPPVPDEYGSTTPGWLHGQAGGAAYDAVEECPHGRIAGDPSEPCGCWLGERRGSVHELPARDPAMNERRAA